MKQKIVIRVEVHCNKCRTKALQIAASAAGVSSVALDGSDKDKVVVVGEGIDAAELTKCLRKKVNHATLESVEEEKVEKKKSKDKTEAVKDCRYDEDPTQPRCELYQVVVSDPDPPYTCFIM